MITFASFTSNKSIILRLLAITAAIVYCFPDFCAMVGILSGAVCYSLVHFFKTEHLYESDKTDTLKKPSEVWQAFSLLGTGLSVIMLPMACCGQWHHAWVFVWLISSMIVNALWTYFSKLIPKWGNFCYVYFCK